MYVPVHKKLKKTALANVLRQYDLDFEELPLIKIEDAAVQALQESGEEISVDDVIRISRKSKTGGEDTPYFRRVVS
jgi:DNA-directed RNA polymerase subunit H (RpoH/RPB5)